MDKDRDTEAIAQFCKEYKEYVGNVSNAVQKLQSIADSASGALPDEVGKRAIERVEEFCNVVRNILDQGEEPIRNLELRNNQMQEDMEQIKRRMR